MQPTIYEDAVARPDLFRWFGISQPAFETWLEALSFRIHPELVEFWRRTGGGDLFETETVLGPLVAVESDNVLKTNEFHWGKGLPHNMLIFHVGLNVSALSIDQLRDHVSLVTLKPGSYEVEKSFTTFGEWYRENLRSEYAATYNLRSS